MKLKLIGIVSAIILLVVGAAFLIAPMMVDKADAEARLRQQVQELTGRDLVVGDVSVSVFPKGEITFHGVAIANSDNASASYFLNAEKLIVHFSVLSALTGSTPKANNITLDGVKIELERFRDGSANWMFLSDKKSQAAAKATDMRVVIRSGLAVFTHHKHDYYERIQDINGEFSIRSFTLSGNVKARVREQLMTLGGNCLFASFKHLNAFDGECQADVNHAGAAATFKGRVIQNQKDFSHRSQMSINATDMRTWIDILLGRGQGLVAKHYANPIPMIMSVDAYSDKRKSVYNITSLKSGDSSGKGSISTIYGKGEPHAKVNLFFDRFNYDDAFAESDVTQDSIFAGRQVIPTDITADISLRATQSTFHGADLKNVTMQADLAGGEIIVTNGSMRTPHKGNLITLGRLSNSKYGIQYDGQVESYGDSLHALIPFVGLDYDTVPKDVFTSYRARFNVIARPDSTTFSEVRLVTGLDGKTQIAGGINMFHGSPGRMNGTIAVKNIDLDPFEKIWRGEASLFDDPSKMARNPIRMNWLKDYAGKVNIQFDLDNYTLYGLGGKRSTVTVEVEPRKIKMAKMNVNLGGSSIKGHMSIAHPKQGIREAVNPRPFFEAQLMISKINLGNAFLENVSGIDESRLMQDSVWTNHNINFLPLHHFDGQADLRIRRLKHDRFMANGVRGQFELDKQRLSTRKLRLNMWAGDVEADVMVDSEVVPGIDITYKVMNANLVNVLESFVDYKNVTGLLSLSGKMRMSGVNFNNWLDSIAGTVSLDARNVYIRSFNLSGIIRAISTVRAVSGLDNAIRLALERGSTGLANVNGTTYFSDGKWGVSRITFRADETVGEIKGSLDLKRWVSDVGVHFGLTSLAQTNYPTLVAFLTGPVNMPKLQLNTKSVEAFLAQKIR